MSPETKFRIIHLKVLRNSLPKPPKIASIQQLVTFYRRMKTWNRWQTNKKQPLMSSKFPGKKRKRRFFNFEQVFRRRGDEKLVCITICFIYLLDGNLTYSVILCRNLFVHSACATHGYIYSSGINGSFRTITQKFSCLCFRCKCSNCSLEIVVKHEECRCCMEVNRCVERMDELERKGDCIISHPGFSDVCLNRLVLHTASIGLKTKNKKSYTTMLAQSDTAEHE